MSPLFGVLRGAAALLFLWLWGLVALTDLRHRKIMHRHLGWAAAGAALGYAALFGNTLLGLAGKTATFHYWGFYSAVLTHVALCGLAAMALWILRVWPAGDAKLFSTLALLYPLIMLTGGFAPERVFLVALINTFIPAALFVFATASIYVFNTRLRSGREFLAQLGWRRELDFVREQLARGARAGREELAAKARAGWAALRERGPRAVAAGAAALVPDLLRWLLGMLSMALISYYLKDFFKSPMTLSLLCVALFMLWQQVRQALGLWPSRALLAAGCAVLLWWDPPTQWERFGMILGSISVFGFFTYLGINWTARLLSGGWTSIASFLIPFALSWVLFLVAQGWRLLSQGARGAWNMGVPVPADLAGTLRSPVRRMLSGLSPQWAVLVELSAMGLFFGLSLVLVRRWDDEVRPSHPAAELASRLLLSPAFIDRVRQDAGFFASHFSSVYADGLTFEQAEALKGWCARRGIEKVPLAPTMSFAAWIFFGYFLSMLLQSRHVLEVLL